MLLEGHTETASFKNFRIFKRRVGLDMADEHRLLDQRVAFSAEYRVVIHLKAICFPSWNAFSINSGFFCASPTFDNVPYTHPTTSASRKRNMVSKV